MTITFENIHVRLGGKEILKGVNLSTTNGKITGIIGPNGCGKSTLIKTIFGICKRTQGEIYTDGTNIREYSPRQLASMIGYVGQDSAATFDFSVEDIIAMGLYARHDRKVSQKEAVQAAMRELDITELAGRSILSLSGGERKMVYIARAVVQGAETLILDEPTNHLDIKHQLFLLDHLKNSGRTVLIVLHDLRLASHYCDHIYLMNNGENHADGEPSEALSEENVRNIFGISGYAFTGANGSRDFSMFGDSMGQN